MTKLNPSQLGVEMTTQVGGTEDDYLSGCAIEIDFDGDAQLLAFGTTQGTISGDKSFRGSDLFLTKYKKNLDLEFSKQVN